MRFWIGVILSLLIAVPVMAQERTAIGVGNPAASWASLQTLLSKAKQDTADIQDYIDKQKACNAKGAFYSPERKAADADGCVKPYIYDELVTKKISDGCNGQNCTASIDMTPYLEKKNLILTVTCHLGWCGYLKKSVTGSIPIVLDKTWGFKQIVANGNGKKTSAAGASYSAATRKVTVKAYYYGNKTEWAGSTSVKDVMLTWTEYRLEFPD